MTDIALLMTGVLTTKQPSPLNLPEKFSIELDNGVEKSTRGQLSQLISNVGVIPPEFIQLDGSIEATPLILASKNENILNTQRDETKVISHFAFSLPEFNTPIPEIKNIFSATAFFPQLALVKERAIAVVARHSQQKPPAKVAGVSTVNRNQPVGGQARRRIVVADRPTSGDLALPTLRFSNSGLSVRVLQRLLVAHGYAIQVDGAFGALTEAAVKAFQNQRNLAVDGIVGPRTWRELTN